MKLRLDDLPPSKNVEDRRDEPQQSYFEMLMAWFRTKRPDVPVDVDPASKLAKEMGADEIDRRQP